MPSPAQPRVVGLLSLPFGVVRSDGDLRGVGFPGGRTWTPSSRSLDSIGGCVGKVATSIMGCGGPAWSRQIVVAAVRGGPVWRRGRVGSRGIDLAYKTGTRWRRISRHGPSRLGRWSGFVLECLSCGRDRCAPPGVGSCRCLRGGRGLVKGGSRGRHRDGNQPEAPGWSWSGEGRSRYTLPRELRSRYSILGGLRSRYTLVGVPPPPHYRERRAGGAVDEIGGELGSWKGNWRWNLYLVHWSWSWLGLELVGAGIDWGWS